MFLLDTDVLSALRRPDRNTRVAAWALSVPRDDLHVSAATIAEIEIGIRRQRKRNLVYAEALDVWLAAIISEYSERILPITVEIARRWGILVADIGHNELDLAIAATALNHGLTVVTRNVSDFTPTGVAVLDPFAL